MDLGQYLQSTDGKYDEVIPLIEYARDIASAQTKYKNYLLDLKEFIDSKNKIVIGARTIANIDELNEYFNETFVAWQGLKNEIANTGRITINYEEVKEKLFSIVKGLTLPNNVNSVKPGVIDFAVYASHQKSWSVSWNGDDGYLLNVSPKVGNRYKINSKAEVTTAGIFYFLYQNPTTEYNGIQSLSDVEDLRLCRCRIHATEHLGKYYSIEVSVEAIFSLYDISNFPTLNYQTSDFWYTFLVNHQPTPEAFGDFLYASINIQSDFGANYIFIKKNGKLHVLLIEEWGVGQATFQYIVNYEIEDTRLKTIMNAPA